MRNVVVTGGSRGLGLGIVRTLMGAGYRVIAVARRESPELGTLKQQSLASVPDSLHFVPFDLGEVEKIAEWVRGLRKTFGAIYGLVNNAGISFEGALAMMPNARIEQLLRVKDRLP